MPKTLLYRYIKRMMSGVPSNGHAAEWKAYTVGRLFSDAGYLIDAVNWTDNNYKPTRTYDAVFDIRYLNRLQDAFRPDTVKMLHLTSADDVFRTNAERARVDEVNAKRGCNLSVHRALHNPAEVYESVEIADDVMLIGNETTLHTYPERYWGKIQPIDTVASYIGKEMMGKLLFRYTGFNFETMPNYLGHGTKWTYYFLYELFKGMGYDVTLLPWQQEYTPDQVYDVVFSLMNFLNCIEGFGPETVKLLRLTMFDPATHNQIVRDRIDEVNKQRDAKLEYHRLLPPAEHTYDAIEQADMVFMNGDDTIMQSYPEEYWDKMTQINVPASDIGEIIERDYIPYRREFMWHFGGGSVHKGLDLCLEVFKQHPEWHLHIVGKVDKDFGIEFASELNMPNVHYHGWMIVSGKPFQTLMKRCFAFIAPSCSEGQSPAVATCLQLGLYPIISKQCGITLPKDCGLYLDELTAEDVESKVKSVWGMDDESLLTQIERIQPESLIRHSRRAYMETMRKHIEGVLGNA